MVVDCDLQGHSAGTSTPLPSLWLGHLVSLQPNIDRHEETSSYSVEQNLGLLSDPGGPGTFKETNNSSTLKTTTFDIGLAIDRQNLTAAE